VLAAELNVGSIYVSGDHDGTPNIGAVVPAPRAKVFADAVQSHMKQNARYASFEVRVHGVNADNEPQISLLVTNEAVTERVIET
jgi:hypothetical protein